VATWARGEGTTPKVELTQREVLRLVAQDKTNKEIGRALNIGAKAVEKHLGEIFGRLNVP
jgi:DNA-binding CsgD family transcriptional regulator